MPEENKNQSVFKKAVKFFTQDIWEMSFTNVPKWKTFLFSLIRVVTTSIDGAMRNRLPIQAASLSYTTLLALGPIIAFVILLTSNLFKDQGDNFMTEKIMQITSFVMPAMNEFDNMNSTQGSKVVDQIKDILTSITKGSGKLNAAGALAIMVTCLLVCVNLENAFNVIWGVEKGRGWMDRIKSYWFLMFFGTVGILFGMTFLAGSQISSMLKGIPILEDYAGAGTYLIGFGAIVMVLTCFYKFMPYTYVKWGPALGGAFLVTLLLIANNKFSFFYIGYIAKQQNFYGFFAMVPLALFSLYIFSLLMLIGSQLTYAIQNIDFLSRKQAWKKMSFFLREMISLSIFSRVSEAFYDTAPAPSADALTKEMNLPSNVIKECVADMIKKNLISPVDLGDDVDVIVVYKPAIPPDSITLAQFFQTIRRGPNDDVIEKELARQQGLAAKALESLREYSTTETASKTIRELIGR